MIYPTLVPRKKDDVLFVTFNLFSLYPMTYNGKYSLVTITAMRDGSWNVCLAGNSCILSF